MTKVLCKPVAVPVTKASKPTPRLLEACLAVIVPELQPKESILASFEPCSDVVCGSQTRSIRMRHSLVCKPTASMLAPAIVLARPQACPLVK